MEQTLTACPECNAAANGKFCSACGARVNPERITLHGILHEVFHYFTHLDKGFGYTLKRLATRPGTMQREYIDGHRARHQKPFSMFFVCGTISGILYFLIGKAYDNLYGADSSIEGDFFRHYFVLLQAVLSPLYAFISWIAFRKWKRNYAEMLVFTLYHLSFVVLAIVFFQLLRLLFPHYNNQWLELAFLLFYNPLSHLRFFRGKLWEIVLRSILVIAVNYFISQAVSGAFRGLLHH